MTIIHDTWGEVEGVAAKTKDVEHPYHTISWERIVNGRTEVFFFSSGWREKVVERWEEDSGYLSTSRAYLTFLAGGIRLPLTANRRWAVVERYDLPANWRHLSINEGAENLTNWVEQFKRPCLIIERKVEG